MAYKDKEKLRIYQRNYQKKYRLKNLEKVKRWNKISYDRNIEKRRLYDRKRYQWERKKRLARRKLWGIKNRAYLAEYKRNRRKDPYQLLEHYLRNRLYQVIRQGSSREKFHILLGCSTKKLKCYLERKFKKGMSWKNYGKWHVDHIIPLNKFNLQSIEEQKLACYYTNLQPLWAKDNIKKGKRMPGEQVLMHSQ